MGRRGPARAGPGCRRGRGLAGRECRPVPGRRLPLGPLVAACLARQAQPEPRRSARVWPCPPKPGPKRAVAGRRPGRPRAGRRGLRGLLPFVAPTLRPKPRASPYPGSPAGAARCPDWERASRRQAGRGGPHWPDPRRGPRTLSPPGRAPLSSRQAAALAARKAVLDWLCAAT